MSDTTIITNFATSVNVSANKFTICYNDDLNVRALGHKPTDVETAAAQSNSQKKGKPPLSRKIKRAEFFGIQDFAEFLKKGHTIYAGVFIEGVTSACKKQVDHSRLISVDFDFPSVLLEQVRQHPFVKQYGAIAHPSYRAVLDNLYKFHLYFITDSNINADQYQKIWKVVTAKLGLDIDASKKGAENLFFGSKHDPIVINENAFLPVDELLAEFENKFGNNKFVTKNTSKKNSITIGNSKPNKVMSIDEYDELPGDLPDESVTIKASRHIYEFVVSKILDEHGEKDFFNKFFPFYVHNFAMVEQPNDPEIILKAKGANPWKPPTTNNPSSFVVSLKDNGLAPVFYDGSSNFKDGEEEKTGGSIFTYWYHLRPDAPWVGKSLKEAFKEVVHDICDHFDVPRFDFRSTKLNDSQLLYNRLQKTFGERLRFNEMALKVEIDAQPLKADTLTFTLAVEHNITGKKERIKEGILYYAEKRIYHPVRDYLNDLAEKHPLESLSLGIIDKLSTRYFGTSKPIYDTYVKKMLIGAVARIFEPGCELKTVMVLQGSQDAGKSSWFRRLCGRDWFNDNIKVGDETDKDDKMILRRFWIHEIDEIDRAFRKGDRSALKAFISRPNDNFRKPYGADIETYPRMSIFVATTNDAQILHDPTGSVRFWVIPVKNKLIDFEAVEKERDLLWAAAVHAYRAGIKWWLEGEENQIRDETNEQFTSTDSWDETVLGFAEQFQQVSVSMILVGGFDMSKDRHDRRSQLRVEEVLRKAGWISPKKQEKICGTPFRLWTNPSPNYDKLQTAKNALQRCSSLLVNGINNSDINESVYNPTLSKM